MNITLLVDNQTVNKILILGKLNKPNKGEGWHVGCENYKKWAAVKIMPK